MEAIVVYNYIAREPDELTIKRGDVIKEIKIMFGGWWEGTLRDKRGMFPDNFVKLINSPSGVAETEGNESASGEGNVSGKSEDVTLRNGSGRKWCEVVFSYEPCNDDELKLVPQDHVEFLGEVEEGWWRGRLRGQIGVFPSNFVSSPIYEEPDKQHKEKEKRSGKITVCEECKVLFPYKAANEDELTLVEGDIIKLLSRDAPDKGWWKGELRGQVGLFPDNFVEVMGLKNENQDQENCHEPIQTATNSLSKYHQHIKKIEKAHVRKSLDVKNFHTGEELDGVERGEGGPLSHLTASRAKAPRRRPPTAQHLRHHTTISATTSTVPAKNTGSLTTQLDGSIANGNAESCSDQLRDTNHEVENVMLKARRKAPWVEELKLNQLERRKIASIDRVDKLEMKKEKTFSRILPPINVPVKEELETLMKPELNVENTKQKDRDNSQRIDSTNIEDISPCTTETPAFVPYSLYNQLLKRVVVLEEQHTTLQQTIGQLSEQLIPLLGNITVNNKV